MWIARICLLWSTAIRIAQGEVAVEGGLSYSIPDLSPDSTFMREVQKLNDSQHDLMRQVVELQTKIKEASCRHKSETAALKRQLAQENASSTLIDSSASGSSTSGSSMSGSSMSGSSMSGSSAGDDHGAHGHQHDALVYLVVVLLVGTAILHLTTFQAFNKLPFTVVLFVLGMITSGIMKNMDGLGLLGGSYEMWMDIDPHLLIFTMLPVLLTGDAMALDTSVAKRVSNQCIWLAGPGVLMGSFGTASFLWIYLKWDYLLCVCTGAILSATDPVAVVGLLKELGASPTLTVQIQGESLLNDGTAMVLFNVAYNMLKGETHNVKSILILLVYMVGCSWFLGMVIGGVFSTWIKAASNRLEHHSNMVQILLTICCAYGSFVFSEGVIGLNGVLSTVATALVLADTIWPKVVSPEAMHEVWHTFEYIGNTLIFFLAGAIGGRSLFLIEYMDVVHLMIIYVVLLFFRAIVMFGSRPVLRCLSPDRTPVTAADAALMTWGGLRGAVGLALSIQVMRDKAGGNIDEAQANRVFFYTAGIAFLTLIVNATTCPSLVDSFGIASTSTSKTKIMLDIVHRLEEKCEGAEGQVKHNIDHMLHEVNEHLTRGLGVDEFERWSCLQRKRTNYAHGHDEWTINIAGENACRSGRELVNEFKRAKRRFKFVPDFDKKLLGWDPDAPLLTQEKNIIKLALGDPTPQLTRTINEAFLSLVRGELWSQIQRGEFVEGSKSIDVLLNSNTKAFQHASKGLTDYEGVRIALGIVSKGEEENIESADIGWQRSISGESMRSGNSPRTTRPDRQVSTGTQGSRPRSKSKASDGSGGRSPSSGGGMPSLMSDQISLEDPESDLGVTVDRELGLAQRIVKSAVFQGGILFIIMCNAVVIVLDPGPDSEDSLMFAIIDCFFMVFYISEFVLKLKVLGKRYFLDAWNALDFMCVILGLFGITTAFLVDFGVLKSNAISSEMMLIRLGRVFKLLRIMRVVGLIKFARKVHAQYNHKKICPMLAVHLELLFTLRGFVQAHVRSHAKFLVYFGAQNQHCVCGNKLMPDSNFCRKCGTERPTTMPKGSFSAIDKCEYARCILESWTAIYNAAVVGSMEISDVDHEGTWILEALTTLRDTAEVTNDLTNFVMEAAQSGVILAKNAESIIHPMHHHVRMSDELLAEVHSGILGAAIKKQSTGTRSDGGRNGVHVQAGYDFDAAEADEAAFNSENLGVDSDDEDNEPRLVSPAAGKSIIPGSGCMLEDSEPGTSMDGDQYLREEDLQV